MAKAVKRKSKKVKVQIPEMGVVSDLKSHAKNLIKKHGRPAVDKVKKHLESYLSQGLDTVGSLVGKTVKSKLPKILHGTVDKGIDAAKNFAHNKGKNFLKKGEEFAQGKAAQVK